METPTDSPSSPGAEWLPPEVLDALNLSAVNGIRVLKENFGLGLYEAKQAIDAFLQRHPEHPSAPKLCRQDGVSSNLIAPDTDFVCLDPVAGKPLALRSLPRRISLPTAYVVLQAMSTPTDQGSWLDDAIRACIKAVNDDLSSIHVMNEEPSSGIGDLAGATLKVMKPLTIGAIRGLENALLRVLPAQIDFRVVRSVTWEDASALQEELEVEYFLREFSRHNRMVPATTNCVKLTHRASGIAVRCTEHRSRIVNYEEALLLLASLLKNENEV